MVLSGQVVYSEHITLLYNTWTLSGICVLTKEQITRDNERSEFSSNGVRWKNKLNIEINRVKRSIEEVLEREIWKALICHHRIQTKVYTQPYTFNMLFPRKKQNRFQLSFKGKEVPIYLPMEKYLMEKLGITTRSDTYKKSLKHLYQTIKKAEIELVWKVSK